MLNFFLGAIFGGFVTFFVVVMISINRTDEERMQQNNTSVNQKNGDRDDGKSL